MVDSLYIHIPFCRKKCLYCDFYSIGYQPDLAGRYIDVLCRQIKDWKGRFKTIYIGGGTPTVLAISDWQRLLKVLKSKQAVECEFTVEANPESLTEAQLKVLVAGGLNRISIGLQSLSDEKLKKLGRIHSAGQALEAVAKAKKSGIDNISIDLIFGLWQEKGSDWQKELEKAVKLPVKHISLYSLTYEKGTLLFKAKAAKTINPLDEARVAGMYKYAVSFLNRKGFQQYEISNFSKPGYQCRHNLNYWDNQPYLGLGASAVTYQGGVRKQYLADCGRYIKAVKSGKDSLSWKEKLLPERRAKETAAVKIRTVSGIDFDWFKAKTGFDFLALEADWLKEALAQHLVRYRHKDRRICGLVLTKKGLLFSDSVSSLFL
ncbi:MAG: radical SAM family heme chaperone HemW [Candidatus Omnitrophica bacterium]|nr:radical SAM family heme chaperone HemW [Candidatus Omnitrophota bacterium]MBU2250821.1 radical SAM family heme chaperone HemW [Candidatus Omnitrophota bacterium]